jgi:DNA-binding transcriptional LysR family regulator
MVRPDQSTLVAKKIGDVALGAFAHRTYLARKSTVKKPTDILTLDLIGSDTDTSILQGFQSLGFPITRESFAFRSDDFIVQWRAVQAGLGVGFLADYMVRTDPDIVHVLPGLLKIPPLPMWLAVHREIRTNPRIRSVFDFLAEGLAPLL